MKPSDFDTLTEWQRWQAFHSSCATANAKHRPMDRTEKALALLTAGVVTLLIATGLLISAEWLPAAEEQQAIHTAYKARMHSAVDVAQK